MVAPRLVVVVKHLLEACDHYLALVRKDVLKLAELAPAVRQTVTPDQRRFIGNLVARQRVRHRQWFVETRRPFVQESLEVFARMTAA